jgi:hypothetical protein
MKGQRWVPISPPLWKISSTISSPSKNQVDKAVKSGFLEERRRLFSKERKKRVLSERGNFLKKTHLKFFLNCLKLFSKDAIFSLKEESLWRNFSQDTARQVLNRMVQGKLPSTLLGNSKRSRTVTVRSSTLHFVSRQRQDVEGRLKQTLARLGRPEGSEVEGQNSCKLQIPSSDVNYCTLR